MTGAFNFGSTVWPSDPTMPTGPPAGYAAPATDPNTIAVDPPMTSGQAEAHRQNFIELIMREVVRAITGFLVPGSGPASEQLSDWAANLILMIAELPSKTWDFIREDLWGLLQKLFSGDVIGVIKTVWGWVTNFIGITGNGGILGMLGAVGQAIKGWFGSSDGNPSIFSKIFGVLRKIWDFFTGWLRPVRDFITGAFKFFGGGTGGGDSALSGIWGWLKNVWTTVRDFLKGAWDIVSGVFGFFGGGSGGNGDSALSGIWGFLKNAWNTARDWFNGIWNAIQGLWQFIAGPGSVLKHIWAVVKGLWDKVFGFIMGAWHAVQGIWNLLTGPNSIWATIKGFFSGSTSLKTRLGETSVGGLVTDVASIISNPDGSTEGTLTQRLYKAVWPVINCFGWVGKLFSLGHNITGFISNPSGSSFGSLVQGAMGAMGLNNIAGKTGATIGDNVGAVVNLLGSPKDPSDLLGGQTLASWAVNKLSSFVGFGDTSVTAGGLFGATTRVGGDFMSMLGSPNGLGTGVNNLTMGPMLPPVNLNNSFGALSPFQVGSMPAGAVANTPAHSSNLVSEGAFRAAITVVEGQGWSWDDTEGRTVPGSLRVEADGVTNEMVANQIPVVAGQSLDMSAYVKWSGLILPALGLMVPFTVPSNLSTFGTDQISIGITGYDYEPLTKTYKELESVDVASLTTPGASGGWSQIQGTYTVPDINTPDVIRFRLKIGNINSGTVWFDEVSAVNTDLVRDNVVPGIGTILDSGVNGLENLGGTNWGHLDFFGAMFGQNAASIGLATRVTQLETALVPVFTPGTPNTASDTFERTSSVSLGASWSQTYTAGNGKWATPNGHDASWMPSGSGAQEVLCRFIGTGALSSVDNQKITAVLGSKAETESFGPGAAHNYLLGRVSSDMLNFILADFDGNGTVKIIRCLAGVRTVLDSIASSTGPSASAPISLVCGTGSGARFFQALINDQVVLEVSDSTSQLGASYRGWGHGARAEPNSLSLSQLSPGRFNSWTAVDN